MKKILGFLIVIILLGVLAGCAKSVILTPPRGETEFSFQLEFGEQKDVNERPVYVVFRAEDGVHRVKSNDARWYYNRSVGLVEYVNFIEREGYNSYFYLHPTRLKLAPDK